VHRLAYSFGWENWIGKQGEHDRRGGVTCSNDPRVASKARLPRKP